MRHYLLDRVYYCTLCPIPAGTGIGTRCIPNHKQIILYLLVIRDAPGPNTGTGRIPSIFVEPVTGRIKKKLESVHPYL